MSSPAVGREGSHPAWADRARIGIAVVLGIGIGLWSLATLAEAVRGLEDGGIHRVHDTGFGAYAGLFLAGGFLAQVRDPQRQVAAFQTVAAALVATVAAMLLAGGVDPSVLGFAVVLAALWWVHPARARLFARGRAPSGQLLGVVLVAAVPLVVYGVGQAAIERVTPAIDPHSEHWLNMASLALSIPLVALVAALRPPGWRYAGYAAAASAVLLGVAWIALPELPSSLGAAWGAVALVGGLAAAGVTRWTPDVAGADPARARRGRHTAAAVAARRAYVAAPRSAGVPGIPEP